MLKDKEPGSFIVRDSHSFRGAYGLAMKVATPPPSVLQLNKKGRTPGLTCTSPVRRSASAPDSGAENRACRLSLWLWCLQVYFTMRCPY